MIAVDTNILARLVTADDMQQLRRVRALFDAHEIWVSTTVLLETNWVLRSTYGYDRTAAIEALHAVSGLPGVILEHPGRIEQALAWGRSGMDFADALHLAAAADCEAFVTFDRTLIKQAGRPEMDRPVHEP